MELSKDSAAKDVLRQQSESGNEGAAHALEVLSQHKVKPYMKKTDEIRQALKYIHNQEFENAIALFKAESDAGNVYGDLELGKLFYTRKPLDEKEPLEIAFFMQAYNRMQEILQERPDDGFIKFRIGQMYDKGYGMEIQPGKALEYYEQAVADGCHFAAYAAGKIYLYNEEFQNTDKAIHYFVIAAEHEHSFALYQLGKLYGDQKFGNYDADKCINYLKRAAELDNTYAQYDLGRFYRNGTHVEMDIGQSDSYFSRALDGLLSSHEDAPDNGDICYRLASIYENGYGTDQDVNSAIEYYEKAIKNEYDSANYALGKLYLKDGEYQDIEKAVAHLNKAAETGNVYAAYTLGSLYHYGEQVPVDSEQANNYYGQALSGMLEIVEKNPNNSFVQNRIAYLYEHGYGADSDIGKAIHHYQLAADQEYENSYYPLSRLYLQDGAHQDIEKGMHFLNQSAETDNMYALYQLGTIHRAGQLVPENGGLSDQYFSRAFHAMEQALQEDPENGFLLYRIGHMYDKGYGIPEDKDTALRYYNQAMELDCDAALYPAANLYKDRNVHAAIPLFEQAAEKGNDMALYQLGKIYGDKGIPYFEKAAEMGNQFAMVQLGECYFKGNGVEKDFMKAEQYYKRVEQDNEFAVMRLGMIYYSRDKESGMSYLQNAADRGNGYAKEAVDFYRQVQNRKRSTVRRYADYSASRVQYHHKLNNAVKRTLSRAEWHTKQLLREFEHEQDMKHEYEMKM